MRRSEIAIALCPRAPPEKGKQCASEARGWVWLVWLWFGLCVGVGLCLGLFFHGLGARAWICVGRVKFVEVGNPHLGNLGACVCVCVWGMMFE
jgi:hypothetical protein